MTAGPGQIALLDRQGNTVGNTLVDSADLPTVGANTWRLHSEGYAVRSEHNGGKKLTIYLHRELGRPQSGQVVDHINGERLDNRRANLRLVTPSENNANSAQRPNRAGFRGVYPHNQTGRYLAQISVDGRLRSLGLHPTAEVAAKAYDRAALQLRGEFARLNFPAKPAHFFDAAQLRNRSAGP